MRTTETTANPDTTKAARPAGHVWHVFKNSYGSKIRCGQTNARVALRPNEVKDIDPTHICVKCLAQMAPRS